MIKKKKKNVSAPKGKSFIELMLRHNSYQEIYFVIVTIKYTCRNYWYSKKFSKTKWKLWKCNLRQDFNANKTVILHRESNIGKDNEEIKCDKRLLTFVVLKLVMDTSLISMTMQ